MKTINLALMFFACLGFTALLHGQEMFAPSAKAMFANSKPAYDLFATMQPQMPSVTTPPSNLLGEMLAKVAPPWEPISIDSTGDEYTPGVIACNDGAVYNYAEAYRIATSQRKKLTICAGEKAQSVAEALENADSNTVVCVIEPDANFKQGTYHFAWQGAKLLLQRPTTLSPSTPWGCANNSCYIGGACIGGNCWSQGTSRCAGGRCGSF